MKRLDDSGKFVTFGERAGRGFILHHNRRQDGDAVIRGVFPFAPPAGARENLAPARRLQTIVAC